MKDWEQIQITRKDGHTQKVTVGDTSNADRNKFGHLCEGIGGAIDRCLLIGEFTRKEIVKIAGTTIGKVNSHINHLKSDHDCIFVGQRAGTIKIL